MIEIVFKRILILKFFIFYFFKFKKFKKKIYLNLKYIFN